MTAIGSVRVRVSGRVQGVGYRYFAQRQATSLGLAGYVRNLPDGEVEVVAQGERSALDSLVEELRRGPPSGVVRHCAVEPWESGESFTAFIIRH
ncbi:MAG: acylphosphatase [Candidatus Latescibacterota bacterium]|jgi:acylphosphatase